MKLFKIGDRVFDRINQVTVTIIETEAPFYTVRGRKNSTPYEQQEKFLENLRLHKIRKNVSSK